MMPGRLRPYVALALATLLLLGACDSDDGEAPSPASSPGTTPAATVRVSPTPSPIQTPAPTPSPRPRPEANPFPDDLREQANQLLQQLSDARGTPARREIDMFLLSREQARAYYAGDDAGPSDASPPDPQPPRFDLKQETYVLLGLIPPPEQTGGRDLDEQRLDNLLDLLTGFYSNEFGAFYLVETINGGIYGPLAQSTIVHELTHALQYQYRDIDSIARDRAGNWDAMTALLDVLEGDAVHTENLVLGFSTRSTYRQPVCFEIPAPQRPDTPYVVERELDTWYEDGLCFIQTVTGELTRGITGVFEDLPTTTEQILHPEKYLVGELAQTVFLDSLLEDLGPGWEQMGRSTFGEFGLQNILLTGLEDDRARVWDAAAGWNGDSLFMYARPNGARLVHLETLWETPADAREFFDALVAVIANRGTSDLPSSEVDRFRAPVADGTTWSASVTTDRVTLLVSTDDAAVSAAARTVE